MTSTPADAPAISRNKSFSTVFLIELWERFGFYGMQVLIVYFMVQQLGFADRRANLVWGAAAALIYVAPAVGGWIGDKILGTRRTMLIGASVLALGYACMSVPTVNTWFLFAAIGVIIVGNGLFKANAGNLVRKIFEGDDSKIDSAFTIYYMAVNVGSAVSQLLTPWVKDYVNEVYGHGYGWHAAFAVCFFGLLVGLANYFVMRASMHHIGSEPDHHPVAWHKLGLVAIGAIAAIALSTAILQYETLARIFVLGAGLAVLAIFWFLISRGDRAERAGLIAALVLVVQTVFFFIFYQQMSSSLALFALRNVDPDFSVFGVHLWNWSPAQFQALNPLWIMVLSPILASLYTRAGNRGADLSIASKFALGFVFVAIGFFVYSSAIWFATNGKANSWVMVWGYGFGALGELLVSGLGLAMIARYVPARMSGFMMGAYFVSSGCSQYLGGLVANVASVPEGVTDPTQTLPIYTTLFFELGVTGVICTLIAFAVVPWMKRLGRIHAAGAEAMSTH
ncbi:peptide MFS transporter [Salinisphaera sp. Q1T1-3]|uniref:peptide MFS transporter n=1 Tax=Salinisphaera sp. Q1T1-3 TaxID=2321229 RepID=UPI000E719805|nr:oligopeptide:H+ symporter [Salinisphaera sp. Q1T1-3]RJS95296.1 MFS transporter [Salinisphaera sp. Q1T1-3]